MTNCTVEVITSTAAFAELEPEWNALAAGSGITHPFVTHEWMWTWWQSFGADSELHILLVREGNRLVAIAPLMRKRQRLFGRSLMSLQFLANDHTPRAEFIIGSRGEAAFGALSGYLAEHRSEWDMVALREVPEGSPISEELRAHARRGGLLWGSRTSYASPYLVLDEAWEETLSGKRRWFLRNRLKKLSAYGEVELEAVRNGVAIPKALEDGFALEAAAWKGEAGTAITSEPRVRLFYTALAERAARRGWLRLQFLKVGGRRVAFAYSLVYANRMYLLKPGFDPEFAACSPGNLLTHLVLRDAQASGVESYDFLGRDDGWKRQWSTRTLSHYWLFLFDDRPWMRAAHYAKFEIIPALQKLPLYNRVRDSVLHLRADS
jgi:CelD/BcsL family acetyltransferase involved in cellulose biosynthesis